MANHKSLEDLTIADDYMFKLVMSRLHICKQFLEMLLKIKISILKLHEAEKTIKNSYDGKGIRLDVYVEDDKNTVFDIEMQVRQYPEETLGRRTRYYRSSIDFYALEKGQQYKNLKNSIIIFICPFKIFDGKRHIYTFRNICQENKKIVLNDGAIKIFLSTKGKIDDVDKGIKNFLNFVEGLPVQGDSFVESLEEAIKELKQSEKVKVDYMFFLTKIDEERADAKEEGRKEGHKDMILNMLKDGLSLDTVARIAKTSVADIVALQKSSLQKV